MDHLYREAVTKMEAAGVDPEYVLGWQGGYLGHPTKEQKVRKPTRRIRRRQEKR